MKFRLNIKQRIKSSWEQLRHLRDAPHAVAGGVAIGIFWGFTPLTGLKTLLSILTAWAMRCSKLPAVVAVALHDVLLPVWPVILRWEYQLGFWILNNHQFPPKLSAAKVHMADLFRWKTLHILWPTFLGSCVIGLPLALVSYWIVESVLEGYEKARQQHAADPPEKCL